MSRWSGPSTCSAIVSERWKRNAASAICPCWQYTKPKLVRLLPDVGMLRPQRAPPNRRARWKTHSVSAYPMADGTPYPRCLRLWATSRFEAIRDGHVRLILSRLRMMTSST